MYKYVDDQHLLLSTYKYNDSARQCDFFEHELRVSHYLDATKAKIYLCSEGKSLTGLEFNGKYNRKDCNCKHFCVFRYLLLFSLLLLMLELLFISHINL